MNIFVLDPSPEIAASYHCDQHLHKMILESAQMLSNAMHKWWPDSKPFIYKPAYEKHPCTIWVCTSQENALWVADLMWQLNEIRLQTGSKADHSSLEIANVFHYYKNSWPELVRPSAEHQFIFAGPPQYKLRPDLNIVQKYQELYKYKYRLWLDTNRKMSYSGRSIPPFMADAFNSTTPATPAINTL